MESVLFPFFHTTAIVKDRSFIMRQLEEAFVFVTRLPEMKVSLIFFCAVSLHLYHLHHLEVLSQRQETCADSCSCTAQCNVCRPSKELTILCLKGSHQEMGVNYGRELKSELQSVLSILQAFYVNESKISWDTVVTYAYKFYSRYAYDYEAFLEGIAEGSGLQYDDIVVINGMITLSHYIRYQPGLFPHGKSSLGHCAYGFVPPNMSTTQQAFHLRNYDFHPPMDEVSKHLAVVVLAEANRLPVAIVGLVGQIYCPTCINSRGLFLELNNGMPSGGSSVADDRKSLLIKMLEYLQDAENLDQLGKELASTISDYSLVLNTGDNQTTISWEFSSVMGMEKLVPPEGMPFASTNYFQSPEWGSRIPIPTDEATWIGVTRQHNLQQQLSSQQTYDTNSLLKIMDLSIDNGGARWNETLIQVVFDTANEQLYLKSTKHNAKWINVNMTDLFSTA